jgi:hypothetical protein
MGEAEASRRGGRGGLVVEQRQSTGSFSLSPIYERWVSGLGCWVDPGSVWDGRRGCGEQDGQSCVRLWLVWVFQTP